MGRRRSLALLLLILAALAVVGWNYRVTRLEYCLARGQEAVSARDWKAVERLADQLESAGYADHAHWLRAEVHYARKRPDEALAECNLVRDQGEIRLRAATLSGKCLLELGEFNEADRVFRFIVQEQPENTDAHRGLAAVAYDLGQMDRALAHLGQVSRLDPTDARPHRLMGNIFGDVGSHEKAEAAYREALRLADGLPTAARDQIRSELAGALVQQSKFADALTVLNEASTDGPGLPTPSAVRVEALRGVGKGQEAAALADRAIAESPDGVFFRLRGQLYLEGGDARAAVPLLERAIRLEKRPYQAYFLLAQAYAAVGRKADADRAKGRADEIRKDLDRATDLNREAITKPWDPKVRLQLAEVFDRLGEPDLARMWRQAAAACREQPR